MAQCLDRTQSNVYLLQTTRQSLTKATVIRQYNLGINCLDDNNQQAGAELCQAPLSLSQLPVS